MLTVGTYLADRYEIVSKIGAGGMSDVYKAKDHVLGRFVAIKVLRTEFSEDRTFVAKFRTEAQSAAGLEHPNIVNIYDVGSEEGLYFIVMEYVEGITLKTYIEKKGQLSFKESVSIAIQVARGIEAAHNKQITHRDIKPQNIIISTEGKVKVTDFVESGREAELLLESVGIVTNKNLIPFDTLNSNLTSGIRIGSPLMTTRGAKEAEMEYIGHLIGNTLKSKDDKDKLNHIAEQVKKIVNRYPMFSDEWVVMK